jgi:pimeloyl-ACP methyl ester carboxylesterase
MTQIAPRANYAFDGGAAIAYGVSGDGPIDLVYVQGFVSHIELMWECPQAAEFFERSDGGPDSSRSTGAGSVCLLVQTRAVRREPDSSMGSLTLFHTDIGGILDSIHVPTQVLHRADDRLLPVLYGRQLADRIAGASFVELPGGDRWPFLGDTEPLHAALETFVLGAPVDPPELAARRACAPHASGHPGWPAPTGGRRPREASRHACGAAPSTSRGGFRAGR